MRFRFRRAGPGTALLLAVNALLLGAGETVSAQAVQAPRLADGTFRATMKPWIDADASMKVDSAVFTGRATIAHAPRDYRVTLFACVDGRDVPIWSATWQGGSARSRQLVSPGTYPLNGPGFRDLQVSRGGSNYTVWSRGGSAQGTLQLDAVAQDLAVGSAQVTFRQNAAGAKEMADLIGADGSMSMTVSFRATPAATPTGVGLCAGSR